MSILYVTTPIYYANDEPHIGHAYTTLLADVLARYHRLFGQRVFFLTGTDEHGQKNQDAARRKGREPEEYCEEISGRFRAVWRKLGISHDDFIRTTEQRHKAVVRAILETLYERDLIYPGTYEGWYCVHEERFWTAKDLFEGSCPDCGRPVTRLAEKNYFFRMSKYQDWLVRYIKEHPGFIQPDFRRNEVLGFLRQPLGDLCISRPKTRLSWGVELPFDPEYVCYVWFDALINYLSAPGYLDDPSRFHGCWPAVHLIGKDILITHAVYWPTMLKALEVEPPRTIFTHGWWLQEKTKMSKSLGNVIRPLDLADRYGVDPFRYFLIRQMTPGQDAAFSEEAFRTLYNADLANDLGNLLSRLVRMVFLYLDGAIPDPGTLEEREVNLRQAVQSLSGALLAKIQAFEMNRAAQSILDLVGKTNRYIDRSRPWALAREGDNERLSSVLYTAAEALRLTAVLLSPVMPEKSRQIMEQLGLDPLRPESGALSWGGLPPGTKVRKGPALFPRIGSAV